MMVGSFATGPKKTAPTTHLTRSSSQDNNHSVSGIDQTTSLLEENGANGVGDSASVVSEGLTGLGGNVQELLKIQAMSLEANSTENSSNWLSSARRSSKMQSDRGSINSIITKNASMSNIYSTLSLNNKSMQNLTSVNHINSFSTIENLTSPGQHNVDCCNPLRNTKKKQSGWRNNLILDNIFLRSNSSGTPSAASSDSSLSFGLTIPHSKNKLNLGLNKDAIRPTDKQMIPLELNQITPTTEIPPTLREQSVYTMDNIDSPSKQETRRKMIVDGYGEIYDFSRRGESKSGYLEHQVDKNVTDDVSVNSKVHQSLKTYDNANPSNAEDRHLIQQWETFFVELELHKQKSQHGKDSDDFEKDVVGQFGSILKRTDNTLYKKFCKLVRMGVPLKMRSKVWSIASGSKYLHSPGEFELLLNDHRFFKTTIDPEKLKLIKISERQIDLDCGRTMRSNIFFKDDTSPGLAKLRKILIAFARKHPHIGYCQGMNIIVGCLLLVYVSERETFDCFDNIVINILDEDFFKPPFETVKTNVEILTTYFLPKNLPRLSHYLFDELGINCHFFLFNWFLTLFINVLPIDMLFKVWDSMLSLNGEIELFKVTIAIFKFFEDIFITEFSSSDEIYDFLINLKLKIISYNLTGDTLMSILKSFDGTITQEKLTYQRSKHKAL